MRARRPHNRSIVRLTALLCAGMLVAGVAPATGNATSPGAAPSAKKLGPVLFIGDSVGASIKRLLPSLLDDGGYSIHFAAKSGRCTKRWSTRAKPVIRPRSS